MSERRRYGLASTIAIAAAVALAVAGSWAVFGDDNDGRPGTNDARPGPPPAIDPDGPNADGGDTDVELIVPEQIPSTPREDVPSALDDPRDDRFPEPLVDPDELRAGGPPPDGIPALDEPRLERVGDVDWLEAREPVLSLELDGEARAYPIQVMTWHEIVNDTVAGRPVTVSYCPLCNSAIAYDRAVGDRVLDFGTSGSLYQSALIMYDRQTESLWSHFTGQAIIGHLTGTDLELIPIQTISWEEFAQRHPDGLVLSRETGFSRDYGRNPYPGYDSIDTNPFLFDGEVDDRLPAQTRVVAVRGDDATVAVVTEHLAERRVVELTLEGRELVALLSHGTASGLDAGRVAEGRDVGATGVFVPRAEGRRLTLTPNDDGTTFTDTQTASTWSITGEAIEGPLQGAQLERVEHLDTFWFAIAAFEPGTEVIGDNPA